MIYRNEDGSIYKVKSANKILIPVLPSTDEMKPLENKVDDLKKAILEIEEVINYVLEKYRK